MPVTIVCLSKPLFIGLLQENKFDGLVLEVWSQLGGRYTEELIKIIRRLGRKMKKSSLALILVVPPPVYHG